MAKSIVQRGCYFVLGLFCFLPAHLRAIWLAQLTSSADIKFSKNNFLFKQLRRTTRQYLMDTFNDELLEIVILLLIAHFQDIMNFGAKENVWASEELYVNLLKKLFKNFSF